MWQREWTALNPSQRRADSSASRRRRTADADADASAGKLAFMNSADCGAVRCARARVPLCLTPNVPWSTVANKALALVSS
jgi:hypothetical protein